MSGRMLVNGDLEFDLIKILLKIRNDAVSLHSYNRFSYANSWLSNFSEICRTSINIIANYLMVIIIESCLNRSLFLHKEENSLIK